MIHQCYFDASQRSRLFAPPLYRGFGLYSAVNPDLARNCPELTDPANQPLLSEYGAMLHHWRNPDLDEDPWIGFTSYRQLDKFQTVFTERRQIESILQDHDVLGWGGYVFLEAGTGRKVPLAEQGERRHPGITSCLFRLLLGYRQTIPMHYLVDNYGLFCNYWIMSRPNFAAFMEWSSPLVLWCMSTPDSYVQSHPRSLSYLVERLFICWYALHNKRLSHQGNPKIARIPGDQGVPQLRSGEALAPSSLQAQPPTASRVREQVQIQRVFRLFRNGSFLRIVELLDRGAIGEGRTDTEQVWNVRLSGSEILLELLSRQGVSYSLRQTHDGSWNGVAVQSPGEPITMRPSEAQPS